ncbi:MAG: hypothetical protein ACJAYG_000002 [Oceanicoccus sp.]|jgi:hypothetical protein
MSDNDANALPFLRLAFIEGCGIVRALCGRILAKNELLCNQHLPQADK